VGDRWYSKGRVSEYSNDCTEEISMVLDQIEHHRQKLNQYAIEQGISSSEVIELSKQLDEFLNIYHKLIAKNRTKKPCQ
jgi:flagellar biosynthesis chaperone FliJ